MAVTEGQRKAFVTVIKVYVPKGADEATPQSTRKDRFTPARQVTDLLRGRDVRCGILGALREAVAPILATDVSRCYLCREGLERAAEGLSPRLSSRFSGLLHKLEQEGLVRAEDDALCGGRACH
jgi:hypothetical protein